MSWSMAGRVHCITSHLPYWVERRTGWVAHFLERGAASLVARWVLKRLRWGQRLENWRAKLVLPREPLDDCQLPGLPNASRSGDRRRSLESLSKTPCARCSNLGALSLISSH